VFVSRKLRIIVFQCIRVYFRNNFAFPRLFLYLEFVTADRYPLCMKKKIGFVWFGLGIWKLRAEKREAHRARCRLFNEYGNVVRILLKCNETQRHR
jgi:hypothetical protein